jgi:ribonuclease HI
MELSKLVIDFKKRNAIKSQVLANFITDWTEPSSYTEGPVTDTPWQMYYDSVWGNTRAGLAAVLVSPSSINLRYATHLQFTKKTYKCTNNIAKYEAVLLGLHKL